MPGSELTHDTNYQRLAASDLPARWVAEHPKGWNHADFEGLMSQLNAAGFHPIDRDKVGHLIESLRCNQQAAPRRTRPHSIPSIEEMQTPQTQASAAWVDGDDFARRFAYQEGDFWLGRSAEHGTPLGDDDERHVIITAGSRSNKGTGVVVPNHCLWEGPLVSLDPKGENANVTAARRGDGNAHCIGMKQKVCVLDPLGVSQVEDKYRARFNPLNELNPDNPGECVTKAAAIADSLVARTGKETDDYWKDEARDKIQALILHIVTSPHYEGRRHLGTLRSLIVNGSKEEWERYEPGTDPETGEPRKKPDPLNLLFSFMMGNPAFEGEIAGAGLALFEMKAKGKAQWTGVYGAMRTETAWLRDPRMRAQVETSDFRLSELKGRREGLSVYLCLPERDMPTSNRWQRTILNLMAYELQGSPAMPACGHRVLMCLDEFAALDKLKEFERGIAYFAGYQVKLMIVLQNLTQIKAIYEDNWEAFLGNSSIKMFFDMQDITTPETLEKWLGEIELVRYAENRSATINAQRSVAAGNTQGSGRSVGKSTQHSVNKSHGYSDGVSDNEGETYARSDGSNRGGSRTTSDSTNTSKSSSYDQNRIFFRKMQQRIPIFRGNETTTLNDTQNRSVADAESWGTNTNETRSVNRGRGRQHTDTYNEGVTDAQGTQETDSVNESRSLTGTVGETVGETVGYQEQFQKRPLIWHNDLRKWFARIKDKSHPYYPGLALLLASAEDPAIVRRVNYFEDDYFEGYYDRHPAHPESDPLPLLRTMAVQPMGSSDERGGLWEEHDGKLYGPVIVGWHKQRGERVHRGERLLDIKPGPSFTGLVDTVLPIYAPVSGWVEHIGFETGHPFQFGLLLGSLRYHLAESKREGHMPVMDELDAYNRGDHPDYQEYLRHKAIEQERTAELRRANENNKADQRQKQAERNEQKYQNLTRERDKLVDAEGISILLTLCICVSLAGVAYLGLCLLAQEWIGTGYRLGLLFVGAFILSALGFESLKDSIEWTISDRRRERWNTRYPNHARFIKEYEAWRNN